MHGKQFSDSDLEDDAKALFAYGSSYDEIAATLSVGKKKVSEWLSRTVKEQKDKRDRKIRELWFACWTLEEIAEVTDCTHPTVKSVVDDFVKSVSENQTYKAAASHAIDFDLPLYNVWKQQDKTAGASHFGNSDRRSGIGGHSPLPHLCTGSRTQDGHAAGGDRTTEAW